MTTIKDVARRAGVSTMTVSRVINKSGYASEETRTRVEDAVAELGYVPNALARHLRSKRTRTVALVLSDVTNPYFTTIARGVEDVAAGHRFAVMFCNTDESEVEEAEYIQMLIERQIDGVLLVPAGRSPDAFRLLRTHNVPLVVLDRRVPWPGADQIRCDSEAGAYLLVHHLVELGHSRIAILSGKRTISTSADRIAGYRRALANAGIAFDPSMVRDVGFSTEAGCTMAREILAIKPRPTAIFAANNFIAYGTIQAIREKGLVIPDDISLVCFDDVPAAWLVDPFLTCVQQDAYTIGRQAAELLFTRLESPAPTRRRSVVLPVNLVVRRSSGPPAAVASSSIPA